MEFTNNQSFVDVIDQIEESYRSKNILPTMLKVIDRLKERESEMESVYNELSFLHGRQKYFFIDMVLSGAGFWNPEKAKEYREGRDRLANINRQISELALDLSELMEEREELQNHSGFSSNTYYDICDVIADAAKQEENYHYSSYIHEEIEKLSMQYDLKYWPSLQGIISSIGLDAENAQVEANNSLTKVVTSSRKSSLSDFVKGFLNEIREKTEDDMLFPTDMTISDNSIATVVNCALGLDSDNIIDSSYIKNVRHRFLKSQQA